MVRRRGRKSAGAVVRTVVNEASTASLPSLTEPKLRRQGIECRARSVVSVLVLASIVAASARSSGGRISWRSPGQRCLGGTGKAPPQVASARLRQILPAIQAPATGSATFRDRPG
jgi:hypothetical protein